MGRLIALFILFIVLRYAHSDASYDLNPSSIKALDPAYYTNMTEMSYDSDSEVSEVKKPVKEVPVVQDQGLFTHDTGDVYDGFFEAKKKDKSVKMDGPGTYTTAEGDVYTAVWDNDKIGASEDTIIMYSDGSKYEGIIKDWSYNGKGKYHYPDSSIMQCEFVDNCPTGKLMLTDPNGHVWLGKAAQGYAWFDPVNHYFDMLEKIRDPGRIKRKHREVPKVEPEPILPASSPVKKVKQVKLKE